jgi:hypothetical protein
MQPNKSPLQIYVKNDTLFTPQKLNDHLAKFALAHVITASYLYNERKYRLRHQHQSKIESSVKGLILL